MIDVDAKVDARDLDKGLAAMASPKVVDDVARRLKKPMREDQRAHARAQEGSAGKWAPRRRIEGRGKKALRRNRKKLLGRLPGATIVFARGGTVTAQSRAKWGHVHQDGGIVGRGARVPAREFLWISDGLMTKAAAELQDAVVDAWGGG